MRKISLAPSYTQWWPVVLVALLMSSGLFAGSVDALGFICSCVNSTEGLYAGVEDPRVPAVVMFARYPTKSFDVTGVCPRYVISVTYYFLFFYVV
jgi:hypothetical protein